MTIYRIHTNDKTEGPRYVIAWHIDDAARAWAVHTLRRGAAEPDAVDVGPRAINGELARIVSIDKVADDVIEGRV